MKNLDKLFQESLADIKTIGIPVGNIVKINVSNMKKNTWAYCYKIPTMDGNNPNYGIDVSPRLVMDDVSDQSLKDTIAHEILHTCKGCWKHQGQWKRYANIVNNFYKGKYHIQTRESPFDKGISLDESYRYVIRCNKCSKEVGIHKKCKTLMTVKENRGGCICGGMFEIVKGSELLDD